MPSSDSSVLQLLSNLSISPKTVAHEAVADNKEWQAALDKTETGVKYHLSKTLVLKPKTAKSAAPTPLVILALDKTETNITAIAKSIALKECRFASEDLLKETFVEDKTSGTIVFLVMGLETFYVHAHTFYFSICIFFVQREGFVPCSRRCRC